MRPVAFLSTVVVVVFLGPLPTHGRTHAGLKEQIIQRIYSELEIEKERERERAQRVVRKKEIIKDRYGLNIYYLNLLFCAAFGCLWPYFFSP